MQLSARSSLRKDAQALHRALGELSRAYQFRDRDRICCYGLSVTQCYALEAMVRTESLTVNELSAELFIDKSTVSRVVRGLEEKGLVARRAHPQDGRAVLLEASQEGRALYGYIEEDILWQEEEILAEFDENVRREIPRLVAALARAAAARVETSGGCCRVK
jgi:DNA-binding MarR family transcriptional regulator